MRFFRILPSPPYNMLLFLSFGYVPIISYRFVFVSGRIRNADMRPCVYKFFIFLRILS